ncbi:CHAT domain-containing protein [Candidatus Gracilibacteria bacterium]|nr:CHAT domain-containing protein [Candidatus Gracilibacteria bacterium]
MDSFEITIQRMVDGVAPVIIEISSDERLKPDRIDSTFQIDIQALNATMAKAEDYGSLLGQALFHGIAAERFKTALGTATQCLRVLLFVEDIELRALRWERLCAQIDGDWEFLARNQRAPLSRYLPSLTDRRFPPLGRYDLRALIVGASPRQLEEKFALKLFDVAAAISGVQQAFDALDPPIPYLALTTASDSNGPATLRAIVERIITEPITILHIVCHGRVIGKSGETIVYLADDDEGQSVAAISASELIEELDNIRGAHGLPQLIFLSTCESASREADVTLGGLAQRLVRDLGVPAVVAMTEKVSVATANALAAQFYRHLLDHGEVDRALVEATARVAESHDALVPVLYSRLGGRPLFDKTMQGTPTAAQERAALELLPPLLAERAPVLLEELRQKAQDLSTLLAVDDPLLNDEQRAVLATTREAIDMICLEATELTFNALSLGARPQPYDSRTPFPGLTAFAEHDRDFFYGRDKDIQTLLALLQQQRFVAVLGFSGSGKSSLLHAGLIPALRQAHVDLQVTVFTPGADALASLDVILATVAPPSEAQPAVPRVALVVDQLEEIFTLNDDEQQQKAFIDRLLALPADTLLVVGLRREQLAMCEKRQPTFSQLLLARGLTIDRLPTSSLRNVIEQQAGAAGLRFEAGLTARMIEETRGDGAMPLLQHTLKELWARRRGKWLREVEYDVLGGVRGAIAASADALYQMASAEEREYLRAIFLRLVRPGHERRDDARARCERSELYPVGEVRLLDAVFRSVDDTTPSVLPADRLDAAEPQHKAIDKLIDDLLSRRLLVSQLDPTSGVQQIELAHDLLLHDWPTLQRWIDEDRSALQLRERLRRLAIEWHIDRDSALLLKDRQLDHALALVSLPRFTSNRRERTFLDAALALRDQELHNERERLMREIANQQQIAKAQQEAAEQAQKAAETERTAKTKLRRRFRILIGVTILAVLALISSLVSGVIALDNLRQAHAQALASDAAAALSRGDIDRALALTMVAANDAYSRDEIFLTLSQAANQAARAVYTSTLTVNTVAFDPDGSAFLAADGNGTLQSWSVADGELLRTIEVADPIGEAHFSPDGATIVFSTFDAEGIGVGDLYRVDAVDVTYFTRSTQSSVTSFAFSLDGQTVYAGSRDGVVRSYDLGSGTEQSTIFTAEDINGSITTIIVDPAGQLLIGVSTGSVHFIDPQRGVATREPLSLDVQASDPLTKQPCLLSTMTAAFSTGSLFTGCEDGAIHLYGLLDGTFYGQYQGHQQAVSSLAVHPYNYWLISSSLDQSVRLWDMGSFNTIRTFVGHSAEVNSLAFNPDGTLLLSGSFDGSARIWDSYSGLLDYQFSGNVQASATEKLVALHIAPADGLISAISDRSLFLQWRTDPEQLLIPELPGPVVLVDDSGTLGLLDIAGTFEIWQIDTQTPSTALAGIDTNTSGELYIKTGFEGTDSRLVAAFSPDRQRLVAATTGGLLRLWSTADGALLRTFTAVPNDATILALAFSVDGSQLLTGDNVGEVILWDVESGALLQQLGWQDDQITSVALSADGRYGMSSSLNRDIILWSLTSDEFFVLNGHSSAVRDVAFSPDSQLVLSASDDGTMRLWEVASGQELARYDDHPGAVTAVAFSSDGTRAFAGTTANRVYVWHTFNREQLVEWVHNNRFVALLPCDELNAYQIRGADCQG